VTCKCSRKSRSSADFLSSPCGGGWDCSRAGCCGGCCNGECGSGSESGCVIVDGGGGVRVGCGVGDCNLSLSLSFPWSDCVDPLCRFDLRCMSASGVTSGSARRCGWCDRVGVQSIVWKGMCVVVPKEMRRERG
jgi:hypothetical protein